MVQAFIHGITVIPEPGIKPFLKGPVVLDQTEIFVLHCNHAGRIVKQCLVFVFLFFQGGLVSTDFLAHLPDCLAQGLDLTGLADVDVCLVIPIGDPAGALHQFDDGFFHKKNVVRKMMSDVIRIVKTPD